MDNVLYQYVRFMMFEIKNFGRKAEFWVSVLTENQIKIRQRRKLLTLGCALTRALPTCVISLGTHRGEESEAENTRTDEVVT